ncbi:hypothetical protein BG011_005584 [Mortierella polycephala]|uniref:Uncharacterized protein n=1 Tax=Mortierella polycephala TaxID=41804 RepID=A0A9P6QFD2_9FUNG|nr:hypothetical protein BG011_005584 [Mortierella polycephala]
MADFSAKMTRQISQRTHSSLSLLTEANLYKHTIISPASREAKLKHIHSYVQAQQELITNDEDLYLSTDGWDHWRTVHSNNTPTRSDLAAHLPALQSSLPSPLPPPPQRRQQQHQLQHQQLSPVQRHSTPAIVNNKSLPSPYTRQQRSPSPVSALYQQQRTHQQSSTHPLDSTPGGLDPSMALPRALPRNTAQNHQPFSRDSFYAGIGQENDWHQLEQLDPDSLAGIHIYGDTADLQQTSHEQPSPAFPNSPLNKYPVYEYTPMISKDPEWQQEQQLQRLQQQSIFRQLQYPDDDDDEPVPEISSRDRRQHSVSQVQEYQYQQQRQLVSPPPTLQEKDKKSGRFSSRFSFLTRRRPAHHQRHESLPVAKKEPWIENPDMSSTRFHSLSHRTGDQKAASLAMDEALYEESRQLREEAPSIQRKSNSRVRQLFKDVFGMSSKRKEVHSPDSAFRDISLPSTHIRAATSPHQRQQLQHQQYTEPSIHDQYPYSAMPGQRKGLVTPVSVSGTAQSNGHHDSEIHYRSGLGSRNPLRESLVDPAQQQHLTLSKLGLDDDGDEHLGGTGGVLKSPFAQTSLTPPPVSSILRHSTSSHRMFSHGAGDCDPTLISPAATVTDQPLQRQTQVYEGRHNARRSSQLMPILKDFGDSGCDSMGGHEPCTTGSSATALTYNNHPSQKKHQRAPLYDFDHGMVMSAYDNGPTIVSIAQVQKVDLEGLRQNHHHHSPSPHSHHLGMVPIETPYA